MGPWAVVVGNDFRVFSGTDEDAARHEYGRCVKEAKTEGTKLSGQKVRLIFGGEVREEYSGELGKEGE